MTTYIIYADPNDGEIQSYAPSYANARAKSGSTVNVNTTGTYARTGQNVDGSGNKYVYESFWSFDTSVIVDAEEVVDVNMNIVSGWTGNNQEIEWGQEFHNWNWTAPVTASSWVDPSQFNESNMACGFSYLGYSTPYKSRYTGRDTLLKSINKTGLTKFVAVSNWTIGGWAPTGTQEIWTYTGDTASKPSLIVYTTALSTMNMVSLASVGLSDGTTVSIRSNGTATPTFTLGYASLTGSWTSIGVLDSRFENTIDGQNSLAVTADPAGNIYVVGVLKGTTGTIIAQAYKRTGTTNAWVAQTALTQAIPAGNYQTIRSIALTYMQAGQDANERPSVYMITGRGASDVSPNFRNHVPGAGWVQDSSLNVDNLLSGTGGLLRGSVNQYSPHWASGVPSFVDMVALGPNLNAVYVQRGKFDQTTVGGISTIRLYNGGGITLYNNSTYTPTGPSKLVAVNSNLFAHIYDTTTGQLGVTFYNVQCQVVWSFLIDASTWVGGSAGSNFTAFYDTTANLIRIYYMSSGNVLNRCDVSPVTYSVSFAGAVNSTFGAASTASTVLRAPHGGYNDERRVPIEASNLSGSTLSTVDFYTTVGNLAPNAPVLQTHANFDAALATPFNWTYTDTNTKDSQTAFDIEFSKASDSSIAFAPAKVVSGVSSYTLPANSLSNGVAYRWRVRTYDTIGTAGTWSSYGTFSTSATGNTTITSPSADNPAGVNTSYYTVNWTYSGTQAQRQVKVVRISDGAVLIDTGMQASTSQTYNLTGLASDTPYRIDVSLINSSSITVPTVSRILTTSYATPMTPTMQLSTADSYISVQTVNPAPVGSRPEITYNDIYRRVSGANASQWILIATVSNSALYRDYAVSSGKVYDYQITSRTVTNAQATGLPSTANAPVLVGVWLHTPSNAQATASNYLYGNVGRTETIGIQSTQLKFVGRTYPVMDTGGFESQEFKLDILVPAGSTEQDQVEWFRAAVRARAILCYRDSRGRKSYVIIGGLSITDVREGTKVSFTATTVDYTEDIR